jgi:tetratricopeptide (TPR) repeat protein
MMSGTLLGLGRVVAARHAAQQAIDLDPHCATAYLYLAEAERMSASPLLEIEDTLRAGLAVAQRPDDSVALRCALAALLLDAERLSEMGLALGGIEHLIEQCSLATRTRLRMRYGELLLAQGQIDRARTYLQETMIVERAAGIASGA